MAKFQQSVSGMKMDDADYVSDDNESLTENPESVDSAF